MRYGTTTEATDLTEEMLSDWRVKLVRAVLFFIPRANPDIERLYPQVRSWALELSEDGWPQREVALDASGDPLFRAPDRRNTGFWTDMASQQFEAHQLSPLSEEVFHGLWKRAQVLSR